MISCFLGVGPPTIEAPLLPTPSLQERGHHEQEAVEHKTCASDTIEPRRAGRG